MKIGSCRLYFLITLNIFVQAIYGQDSYYPDTIWQTRKPAELKMNEQILDSAVNFAIRNETKTDYDLRIANLKAYANEPDYISAVTCGCGCLCWQLCSVRADRQRRGAWGGQKNARSYSCP